MKVYCNIDVDQRKFEGRTQISGSIARYLQKNGYEFTKNPREADLIHFHSSGVADSYHAFKLQQRWKIPCIYSLYSNAQTEVVGHVLNFMIQKIFFQPTATRFLSSYSAILPLRWRGFYLKKLKKVIVPTADLSRKLFANTETIHFGVDTSFFKPLPKIEREGNDAKTAARLFRIAYFGHPGVFKGLNDFVNAAKKLPKSIEAHVYLTEVPAKVVKYIRKRDPRIVIHGFTNDLVQEYNNMDAVVLPYRMQIGTVANPLVLLEAMSCGRPVITTDWKFIREIVGDAAIIVKKNSPAAISRAVLHLERESQLREILGKRARLRVEKEYSLTQMLQSYHRLYTSFEKNSNNTARDDEKG